MLAIVYEKVTPLKCNVITIQTSLSSFAKTDINGRTQLPSSEIKSPVTRGIIIAIMVYSPVEALGQPRKR